MTDEELIQEWRETWAELEDQGGQSYDSTDFIMQTLDELDAELQRRGLHPVYECAYAPDFCPYGCPGSQN